MKNKKLPFLAMLLIFTLMLAPLALSISMPLPVKGKLLINGKAFEGLQVKVTNLRTGMSMVADTSGVGEYQVELANFPKTCQWCEPYRYGDDIYVEACKGFPECSQTFIAMGGSITADFNIVDNQALVIFRGITIKVGELLEAGGYWWFAGFLGLVA